MAAEETEQKEMVRGETEERVVRLEEETKEAKDNVEKEDELTNTLTSTPFTLHLPSIHELPWYEIS